MQYKFLIYCLRLAFTAKFESTEKEPALRWNRSEISNNSVLEVQIEQAVVVNLQFYRQ